MPVCSIVNIAYMDSYVCGTNMSPESILIMSYIVFTLLCIYFNMRNKHVPVGIWYTFNI